MKEIVKLSVRGSISTNMKDSITLNGKDFGETLGLILGAQYIENALVNITICDADQEEKEGESDEAV